LRKDFGELEMTLRKTQDDLNVQMAEVNEFERQASYHEERYKSMREAYIETQD
jgi:hypothetical protein